jgi:hypothetical protein
MRLVVTITVLLASTSTAYTQSGQHNPLGQKAMASLKDKERATATAFATSVLKNDAELFLSLVPSRGIEIGEKRRSQSTLRAMLKKKSVAALTGFRSDNTWSVTVRRKVKAPRSFGLYGCLDMSRAAYAKFMRGKLVRIGRPDVPCKKSPSGENATPLGDEALTSLDSSMREVALSFATAVRNDDAKLLLSITAPDGLHTPRRERPVIGEKLAKMSVNHFTGFDAGETWVIRTHPYGGAPTSFTIYGWLDLTEAPQADFTKRNEDWRLVSVEKPRCRAMFSAVMKKDLSRLRKLIRRRCDPNVRSLFYSTPLHLAASTGQKTAAELLIADGADVKAADESDETPMHLAAASGHLDIVLLLISHGANVNALDEDDETPLDGASGLGMKAWLQIFGGTEGECED